MSQSLSFAPSGEVVQDIKMANLINRMNQIEKDSVKIESQEGESITLRVNGKLFKVKVEEI